MSTRIKRFLLAAILLGTLTGAGVYYFQLFILHPPGRGPVRIQVAETSKKAEANSIWIVGLGDSVTAGFGASPGKSYWDRLIDNRDEEDPALVGKCLRQLFPNLIATNLARSGSTSLQHIKDQLPRVPRDELRKALVVMTTGGNRITTPPTPSAGWPRISRIPMIAVTTPSGG